MTRLKNDIIQAEGSPEVATVTCPVCATAIHPEDKQHVCSRCETPHHTDCWEYTGGCAIFGCRKGELRVVPSGQVSPSFLTTANLKVMKLWGHTLDAGLVVFLTGSFSGLMIGLLCSIGALAGCLMEVTGVTTSIPIVRAFFSVLGYSLLPFFTIGMTSVFFVFLGVIPYVLMMVHFWHLELKVRSSDVNYGSKYADLIEPQGTLVKWSYLLFRGAKSLTRYAFLFSCICGIFLQLFAMFGKGSILYVVPGIAIPAFVAYIYFRAMEHSKRELSSYLSFITSYQNRLVASGKKQ